jgi:hypothetical protein
MTHPAHRTDKPAPRLVDSEIANLDGGLFMGLPHDEIPLDTFRLHDKVIEPDVNDQATTLVMRRVKLDSIAPMSLAAPVVEHAAPAPRRAAPWSFVAGVAVGVGAILGVGLMKGQAPSAPAATQAALVATPMEAEAAVVPAPVPAPPAPVLAAAKAAEAPAAKAEPKAPAVRAAAPSLKAQAPRAPRVAAAPRAPEPAAAPVSTADLPIVMPEIPAMPKAPEVAFNRSAAAVSIASKGMGASSCKDDPGSMSIPVSVTFAASGRVTRATINGGPFKGTSAGSCIAAALRNASVPSFDGEPVTVHTSIHLR